MATIAVKAWGLCVEAGRLVVQYATDGSLYRLPGGTVEASEVSAATIEREMAEEYGITAHVERLVTTWENLYRTPTGDHHEIVLVHRMQCHVPAGGVAHRERPDVRLAWWPLASLADKPTAPPNLSALAVDPQPHLVRLGRAEPLNRTGLMVRRSLRADVTSRRRRPPDRWRRSAGSRG